MLALFYVIEGWSYWRKRGKEEGEEKRESFGWYTDFIFIK